LVDALYCEQHRPGAELRDAATGRQQVRAAVASATEGHGVTRLFSYHIAQYFTRLSSEANRNAGAIRSPR
jgi:hypothetical protein